jgi:hypothetical protein
MVVRAVSLSLAPLLPSRGGWTGEGVESLVRGVRPRRRGVAGSALHPRERLLRHARCRAGVAS